MEALEVQYDMILWTHLFDLPFYNTRPFGTFDIKRREGQVDSTRAVRQLIRKADGIVSVRDHELLLIESAKPDATVHQFTDKIKLAHMLKYSTVQQVVKWSDHPLPLSVFGITTAGTSRGYVHACMHACIL